MSKFIVTFDKSNEDIPTLVVGRESWSFFEPCVDIVQVITGDEAVNIRDRLVGKPKETEPITNENEESKAAKVVFDKLCKCGLFRGRYDAKHGSKDFMDGIGTVMEALAFMVSEECGENFADTFITNLIKSQEDK